jgi:surfeit locus 1 family protein
LAFRPTLWPTLFSVPAFIVLVALGTWQVQRLHWKQDLIDKLQSRSVSAAVAPPTDGAALEKYEYQHVRVMGAFRHDHEFFLINRSLHGNPGLHVLTPLVPNDGSKAILVDRGWVPFERRDPKDRAGGQVTGPVTVDGLVRLQKGPGYFTPANEPAKNAWFYVDTAAMAAAAGIPLRAGYYIASDKLDVPGGFPIGHQWRLDIRNDHLQYAITWYSLALALLVIYILYHRRKA